MKLLQRKLCIAMGLVAAPAAVPAMAQQSPEDIPPPPPGNGLTELSDEEMGDMRGRYTVGHDTVAWFGVTMVSTWQTQAGQTMQGKVTMGIDLSQPDRPKVTFQPHVSITAANAPSPAPSGERNIDHAGLANVSGLVQSVQVAGDANRATNVARITVRDGGDQPGAAASPDTGNGLSAAAQAQGMSAVASLQDNAARVLLQIDGQGAVEQWIGSSGMGQSIRLAADGHQASNWLELDMVRSNVSIADSRTLLGQTVAQAIALSRGIGFHY